VVFFPPRFVSLCAAARGGDKSIFPFNLFVYRKSRLKQSSKIVFSCCVIIELFFEIREKRYC